jgi:hypothetical protein
VNSRPASNVDSHSHRSSTNCRAGALISSIALRQCGVRIGHAAVPRSSRNVVFVQWTVLGTEFVQPSALGRVLLPRRPRYAAASRVTRSSTGWPPVHLNSPAFCFSQMRAVVLRSRVLELRSGSVTVLAQPGLNALPNSCVSFRRQQGYPSTDDCDVEQADPY